MIGENRRQNFFYGLDEFRLVRVGLLDVIDDTGDIGDSIIVSSSIRLPFVMLNHATIVQHRVVEIK